MSVGSSPPLTFEALTGGTLRGRPFRVVRRILLALLVPILRLRIEGLEHVPKTGPVLVVANHLHNTDPVLVSVAFPRPLHYMAKQELFRIPVISAIIRRVGAFPVDRQKADRAAIRRAEATLRHGIAVGMFPEGTRSVTRALKRALPGAAMLALRSGAPVVPVAITGTERLPGNGAKARRRDGAPEPRPGHRGVRIRFGPPFTIPRDLDGEKLSLDAAADLLMAEIARMLPPDYRGVYAEAALSNASPSVGQDSAARRFDATVANASSR